MAKGSSKGGGGGAPIAAKVEETRDIEGAVARINRIAYDPQEMERRAKISEEMNAMPKGTVLSVYKEGERGVVDYQMTYEKQADGTWKNTTEGYKYSDPLTPSGIYRVMDGAPGRRLNAGAIDTSSHVEVTGKPGKAFDGIRYANGTYDADTHARNGEWGKVETAGKIATYNGTQYGVTKKPGQGFVVTHIPTGLAASSGKLKNYTDVSKAIKSADQYISKNSEMFKKQADNFAKKRRLKSSGY